MKHRRISRLRRVAKWAGIVCSSVLAGLWVMSYSGYVAAYLHPTMSVILAHGNLCQPRAGRMPQMAGGRIGFHVFKGNLYPATDDIHLPLWLPFAMVAFPTAYLRWLERRPMPGHCQTCGYDLTGNVSGICPECGESV